MEGHTDNSNSEPVNQKLSEQRLLAICKRLVENGIGCKRSIAVGFGSTKPITPTTIRKTGH